MERGAGAKGESQRDDGKAQDGRVVATAKEAKMGEERWKGGGKGYGYQGTCFKCEIVGYKAVECGGTYEVLEEGEVDAGSKDVGGVWVVAGVEEMRQKGRCGHGEGKNQPPGL